MSEKYTMYIVITVLFMGRKEEQIIKIETDLIKF